MQIAVCEFARNVAGMEGANSTEFDLETPFPVIDLLPEQKEVSDLGGTMRLGADPVKLHVDSRARELYGEAVIYERHRHRYEVNNLLRKRLESAGLVVSGTSPDERLVEVIELDEPPVLRRVAVPPGVQVPAGAPGAAVPGVRRGRAASRRGRRGRRPPGRVAACLAVARTSPAHDPCQRLGERRCRARATGSGAVCTRTSPGCARCSARRAASGRAPSWFAASWPSSASASRRTRPGRSLGGDCGNLVARVPGTGEEWLMICTHLDTVPPSGPIEPVVVDGGWVNAGDGILGADNKAAVAVALGLARQFHAAAGRGRAGAGLHGRRGGRPRPERRRSSRRALRSRIGYTFDHASPIGEIVVASPTYYRLDRRAVRGRRPRGDPAAGRSQRRSRGRPGGRVDAAGAARRRDDGERRRVRRAARRRTSFPTGAASSARRGASIRSRPSRRSARWSTVWATRRTRADCECDLDVSVRRLFEGYRTRRTAAEIRLAEAALRDCGYDPRQIVTGGGSDANALIVKGLGCVNLANGTERNHQPDERVSLAALEGMLDVGLALVRRAAEFV